MNYSVHLNSNRKFDVEADTLAVREGAVLFVKQGGSPADDKIVAAVPVAALSSVTPAS